MELRRFRLMKNKTQQQVADDLGILKQRYQLYELGQRKPDIEMIEKLANYFNVSVDVLLGREVDKVAVVDSLYNKLTNENQKKTIDYIKLLLKSQEK